ncbi:MAG: SMP-30/gluconolactonase/LRE family protein [Terriglobales bacterium]
MSEVQQKPMRKGMTAALLLLMLALTWAAPVALYGDKKKKKTDDTPTTPVAPVKIPDFSNVVFPAPPAITRVKYLDYFSAEKPETVQPLKQKKKRSWMDRMAGTSAEVDKNNGQKPRFQLMAPYGLAVDSKGRLYVADTKVGAIFIFNTENNNVELIKHGVNAKFGSIYGLAMDDNDNLFVSDAELRHVLVFDANHKLQAGFGDGILQDPNGLAIDLENRFIYVADTELDQVLVFDADTYKLLRRIGTTGKHHTLTSPGDFSKPTNVAVDNDGNLYVTDTWNDRVEEFDADGVFIRAFGKNGDGPGDFARPKGIAIDCDGHVWVADAMLNRVQIFTPEGRLLMGMGSFGIFPGQFQALTGLTIDKQNRVFTSEQLLGRTQMFRYTTNDEARAELARRQAENEKRSQDRLAPKAVDAQTGSAQAGNVPPTTQVPAAQAPSAQAPATQPPAASQPPAPNPFQVMKQSGVPVPPPSDKSPPAPPPNH